ncbi:MAG: 2-oxoacid:acceptor oxidoreductase subunit alpha [Eubacteriales bacterium]
MYNLLIGGAAGQGIDTTAAILEKVLKRSGYNVFTSRDFMSRIRGGHNFSLIRFGNTPIASHSNVLDGIIALNEETIELHKSELKADGFILCNTGIKTDDPRAIKIDMDGMAKELGNARVAGSVSLGVLLKLFGEDLDGVEAVLQTFLSQQVLEINVKAVALGYKAVEKRYEKQNGDFGKWMIITGSRALSMGAMAAGLRFYSAYPMSPSTTIMEFLAAKSEQAGMVVEQAEDEIAAINMAIGASYAGARAMTGTSGGGFSLMVEALGLSGMAEIPLVVVDVQRPGPVTGLPTRTEQSDLKFVVSASQGEFPRIVIALRNHTDSFYQTIRAFNLAEEYQVPVILLSDQFLGDASATVEPYDLDKIVVSKPGYQGEVSGEYLRYELTDNGISPRLIPGRTRHMVGIDSDEHDERGWITESADMRIKMVDKRMRKLDGIAMQEPDFIGDDSFDTLLVGWGSVWGPLKEAVNLLNEKEQGKYAALVFGDLIPFPQKMIAEKAEKAKKIINVEQNTTGQLAGLLREHTRIACTGSILKYDGRQITGGEIAERIRKGDLS